MSETKRVGLRSFLPREINSQIFRAELNRAVDVFERHEATTGETIIWATVEIETEVDSIDIRTLMGTEDAEEMRYLRLSGYATLPEGAAA